MKKRGRKQRKNKLPRGFTQQQVDEIKTDIENMAYLHQKINYILEYSLINTRRRKLRRKEFKFFVGSSYRYIIEVLKRLEFLGLICASEYGGRNVKLYSLTFQNKEYWDRPHLWYYVKIAEKEGIKIDRNYLEELKNTCEKTGVYPYNYVKGLLKEHRNKKLSNT
jgi:hypothetical protein